MAGAATAICALGLIDDANTLSPWPKLITEIALAATVAMTGWRVGVFADARLDLIITVLWIVFFTNAFNALDGLDGLAGGVGAVASAFLGIWSLAAGDHWAAAVSWTLAAAAGAFLIYNFPPSRGVFLGDCGALFIGFSVACLVLRATQVAPDHRAWSPLVFVCVPVVDFLVTVIRRLGALSWPLHGDRRHLYDTLYRRWGSMRLVAAAYYAAAIIASVAGWYIVP
jgi:UDP-GlcNAc:undecaprenyl-phosphate GlcNAc-1-phosphate transferase